MTGLGLWLLLAAQPDVMPMSNDALPTWGWAVIVGALASTVATLAALYKRARDHEVAAEQSKVKLIQDVGEKTAELLERAIEAFTTNKAMHEQLATKLREQTDELRELKSEVRRVGEKVTERSQRL